MQIANTSFGYFGIPSKKFCSYSPFSSHLSNVINLNFIVDLVITIYLDDFHETIVPTSVNT